jgi:hypothetical protein
VCIYKGTVSSSDYIALNTECCFMSNQHNLGIRLHGSYLTLIKFCKLVGSAAEVTCRNFTFLYPLIADIGHLEGLNCSQVFFHSDSLTCL